MPTSWGPIRSIEQGHGVAWHTAWHERAKEASPTVGLTRHVGHVRVAVATASAH